MSIFIISAPDYRYMYMNDTVLNIRKEAGIEEPSRVLGKHPWDILADWKDAFLSIYEKARSSKETQVLKDFRYEGFPDAIYWDFILIPNIDKSTHEVASISTIGADVTEHKRDEEERQAREHQFFAVFETSLDAMVIVNDDKRLVDANPKAEALFGRNVFCYHSHRPGVSRHALPSNGRLS